MGFCCHLVWPSPKSRYRAVGAYIEWMSEPFIHFLDSHAFLGTLQDLKESIDSVRGFATFDPDAAGRPVRDTSRSLHQVYQWHKSDL